MQEDNKINISQTKWLQKAMNAMNAYVLREDGSYGPETRRAVQLFQAAHDLPTTGEPDPLTMAALHKKLMAHIASLSSKLEKLRDRLLKKMEKKK